MICKECKGKIFEDKENNPKYYYCENCEEDVTENGEHKEMKKKEFEKYIGTKRVSEYSKDESERIVSIYIKRAIDEFKEEVRQPFFEYMKKRTKSKKITDEVIQELFEESTFGSMMKEDANYVMEGTVEYWIEHIQKEMETVIDFEKLNKEEVE